MLLLQSRHVVLDSIELLALVLPATNSAARLLPLFREPFSGEKNSIVGILGTILFKP